MAVYPGENWNILPRRIKTGFGIQKMIMSVSALNKFSHPNFTTGFFSSEKHFDVYREWHPCKVENVVEVCAFPGQIDLVGVWGIKITYFQNSNRTKYVILLSRRKGAGGKSNGKCVIESIYLASTNTHPLWSRLETLKQTKNWSFISFW